MWEIDAFVRNIVKEIVRECHLRKITINKNFLNYFAKLLLIDPNWGINDNFFEQRENVQEFVKYVTEILTQQELPKLVTLKIQFYFSCNMEHMDYLIETHKTALKSRASPLKEDIFIMTDDSDKDNLDLLLKKIVYYITLITGLGNPRRLKVYHEALAALKSIIDDDELKEFAVANKNVKNDRLKQLSRIVAGIRLFNKDCEKGGEGIENLPELLERAIEVTKSNSEIILLIVMERVNMLTTIMDKCFVTKLTYGGNQLHLEIPEAVLKNVLLVDMDYLRDLLIFYRQYELLLRKIIEDFENLSIKTDLIFETMEKLLKKIHDIVYMRLAIPVDTVFPLFEQLYDIWSQFQEQALILSRYSQIMTNLEIYAKQTRYDRYLIELIVIYTGSMTDAERLSVTSKLKLESSNPEVEIVSIDTIQDINSVELEYLGFCCWKLIETHGALIPGNPSMGIVRYKGKNYVFSCKEAFDAFIQDPEQCINSVLALARRKPQLIMFFRLKEQLENVFNIPQLVQRDEDIRLCENKAIQVPCHLDDSTESNSKKSTWNVWDLKKEALLRANLLSVKTVSTKTDRGVTMRSVAIQTYEYENTAVQTPKDNYANTPKPSRFIYGLRGRQDHDQFAIVLTKLIDK